MKMTRSQWHKVGLITVAWTIVSLCKFIISFGAMVDYGFDAQFDPLIPFRTSIVTGTLAGLLGGSVIVFVWERWLRSKPYSWSIRSIVITYCALFILIALASNIVFQSQFLELPIWSKEVLSVSVGRLFGPTTMVPFVTWLIVVALTVIALLVNDKYGPGIFLKFILGHYFNPRREERIFMFLDLRSSTTVAEEIGEERYFSFLREVVSLATPSILKNKGEIYQYVGDEIVISWELDNGKKDANCINCYFDIQHALNEQKDLFMEKYGNHPTFKAGIHYGHVMAGEIGVVKREIAFSGDVLNTAARIQSKCNELGVNILFSKALMELVKPERKYDSVEIGSIELRGKKEAVTLFTI